MLDVYRCISVFFAQLASTVVYQRSSATCYYDKGADVRLRHTGVSEPESSMSDVVSADIGPSDTAPNSTEIFQIVGCDLCTMVLS